MLAFIFAAIAFVIAQVIGVPDLIAVLTPVFIYLATLVVTWVLKQFPTWKIPGWVIVSVIVPGLALILPLLLPAEGMSYLVQVIYGLLAVFINEVIRQLSQIGTTKAS